MHAILNIGMLSKCTGQILRAATCFHILFGTGTTNEVSYQAIEAAMNFVEVCCQQTAFIAGRGQIEKEIEIIEAGSYICKP